MTVKSPYHAHIPPVRHLIISKRNVADHDVDAVIGKRSALKSVNLDLSLGIEFLGDPTGEGVQFYAVQAAIVHPFRETAEEISGSAGWLQYIPCGKSYIGKYLIHRTDHSRRRIKGV